MMTPGRALLAWLQISLQTLEPCIPSRGVRRWRNEPWFTRGELPPPLLIAAAGPMAIA